MKDIFLKYHLNKYPLMNHIDIIKLIYQEVMGPNHIIKSKELALEYIKKELNETHNDNNLYEYLGGNYLRMDIHKYHHYFNELDSFLELFMNSLSQYNDIKLLENVLNDILSSDELNEYNYLPVSHSESYRNTYLPHYRIIKSSLITLEHKIIQMTNFIDKLPSKSIISLEGRCASGKSTLSENVKDKYTIISIDDFFLPMKLKTKERLSEIGGNINYELVKTTLENLKVSLENNIKEFTYKAFDCSKQEFYDKTISLKDKVILEGVYSASPYFRHLVDKTIYLYIDKQTQLQRINNRTLKERFINEWIPLEERYFDYIKIEEICDLVV